MEASWGTLYAFEEHLVDDVRFADRLLAFTCFRNCGVMKKKNEFTNHNLFINAQFFRIFSEEIEIACLRSYRRQNFDPADFQQVYVNYTGCNYFEARIINNK